VHLYVYDLTLAHFSTERSPDYGTTGISYLHSLSEARSLIGSFFSELFLTTGKEITIEKSYSDARALLTFFWGLKA
jgi:hypothetical protein